jgi:carbamate kinase
MAARRETVVVAIGGNSLIHGAATSVPDQYRAAEETCGHLAAMLRDADVQLVVTHGNGPQVGFILRRSDLAAPALHEVPLDSCVADTQGAIGYHLQRAMRNAFRRHGVERRSAALVTQVLVDADDPAFRAPDKPIGAFMSRERAERHRVEDGWDVVEDAGRGWRRVVASPAPKAILELGAVKSLLDAGFVVIAAGGGGIAVVEDASGALTGASAVIDKDLTSSLLAREIGADVLVISTAVEKVCLDFGKPTERALASMTLAEAKRHVAEGQFGAGSMLPKVKAVVAFLEGGGKRAIITDPEHLRAALRGEAGTCVEG